MGRFIQEVRVKVALLGVPDAAAMSLTRCFMTTGATDPGVFEVTRLQSLTDCKSALDSKRIDAICIGLEAFPVGEVEAFIATTRVAHPLVPFCLAGRGAFLDDLSTFHAAWRTKFKHYFKLKTDLSDEDFVENAGTLRDLFVADAVKCRALGNYETTPGAVLRVRAARPYGFWVLFAATILAAIIGGATQPAIDRIWPKAEPNPPKVELHPAQTKPNGS